jgi:membrane protease YdiL (CAAX protease family)
MSAYPPPRQLLRFVFPTLLLAQFGIWPLFSLHSIHAGMIAAELCVFSFMVLYIRRRSMIPEDLLLLNAVPFPSLIITATATVGTCLAIAELDLLWSRILASLVLGPPVSFQRSLLEVQIVRTPSELGLGLLAVVLFPGVCEELFFRGFTFTSLYVHRGLRTTLLGTSLLFALAHLNPWQLPALLLFGLFLGLLVYWTHSIYPAVLAHLVNNMLSFASVNLRAYFGWELFSPFQHLPLPLTAMALLVAIGSLILLRRQPAIVPLPE